MSHLLQNCTYIGLKYETVRKKKRKPIFFNKPFKNDNIKLSIFVFGNISSDIFFSLNLLIRWFRIKSVLNKTNKQIIITKWIFLQITQNMIFCALTILGDVKTTTPTSPDKHCPPVWLYGNFITSFRLSIQYSANVTSDVNSEFGSAVLLTYLPLCLQAPARSRGPCTSCAPAWAFSCCASCCPWRLPASNPTRSASDSRPSTRPPASSAAASPAPSCAGTRTGRLRASSRASRCRSSIWTRRTSPPSRAADRDSGPPRRPRRARRPRGPARRSWTSSMRTPFGRRLYDTSFYVFEGDTCLNNLTLSRSIKLCVNCLNYIWSTRLLYDISPRGFEGWVVCGLPLNNHYLVLIEKHQRDMTSASPQCGRHP